MADRARRACDFLYESVAFTCEPASIAFEAHYERQTYSYLIALVAFWLVVHNTNEAAGTTAPLTCHFRSITCEAMDVPPFVHHPDVPERDQLALQNPEQPAGVLDTTRVAYDLGIDSGTVSQTVARIPDGSPQR